MTYKQNIHLLNPKGGNQFPDRFGNEIYFVENLSAKAVPFNYVSNFSLKYIFSGEEQYVVNKKRKRICDQQYLAVNNESEVCRVSSAGTSITIFLEPDLISECQRALHMGEEQLLEYPLSEDLGSVELFDDVVYGDLGFLGDLKSRIAADPDLIIPVDYYFELAHQLLLSQNDVLTQMNKLERGNYATKRELFKRVNKARNYLEDTITENFDLNRLSRESCLSKYQLIRDFKSAFGITPHRYFIARKLQRACQMMRSGDYGTLNEVAFELSYSSLAAFSRQFKQLYGVSPGAMMDAE